MAALFFVSIASGSTGSQGNQGFTGLQGERGSTGWTGMKGEQGYKGNSGATGATGQKVLFQLLHKANSCMQFLHARIAGRSNVLENIDLQLTTRQPRI